MRIRPLSDLHLEFQPWSPPAAIADVVVLAGDIHLGVRGIEWARECFPKSDVIYVPGNHEFYGREMHETTADMRRAAQRDGIHFLDGSSAEIGGVRFLGAILWTDFALNGSGTRDVENSMRIARAAMTDYRVIRTTGAGVLSPSDTRTIHDAQVAWLTMELSRPFSGATVVVTHHLPHPNSVHRKYAGHLLNPCFASDLSALMGDPVKLWIHGHTHESMDYVIKGTRVVCNPRGYLPVEPNELFDATLVVDICNRAEQVEASREFMKDNLGTFKALAK